MRSITLPALQFSSWVIWNERSSIAGCHMPGVYLIAITDKELAGLVPQDNWADVSYVGMTHSLTGLIGRWRQFSNAIHGKQGHSGGKAVYGDLGNYATWDSRKKLFVAAMPVECDAASSSVSDLTKIAWVRYLEYEALAEFSRHAVKPSKPRYNTQ